MAMPTETDIAIVQLVFFIPAFFLSIWLWVRYGFRLGAGAWRLVLVLAILRIIAGSAALAAEKNPSTGLYATVLSCDLVGTAPLFLLTLRLVERVNNTYHRIPVLLFRFADLISLLGLALGIVGANKALTTTLGNHEPFHVNGYMIASMSIFIVIIAINLLSTAVLFITVMSGKAPREDPKAAGHNGYAKTGGSMDSSAAGINKNNNNSTDIERNTHTTDPVATQQNEISAARKIVIGIALAIPFLIVRVCFAAIGDFKNDVSFIPYLGNNSIYLGMSVIMEIVATYICLGLGFVVGPPPKKIKVSKGDGPAGSGKRSRRGFLFGRK